MKIHDFKTQGVRSARRAWGHSACMRNRLRACGTGLPPGKGDNCWLVSFCLTNPDDKNRCGSVTSRSHAPLTAGGRGEPQSSVPRRLSPAESAAPSVLRGHHVWLASCWLCHSPANQTGSKTCHSRKKTGHVTYQPPSNCCLHRVSLFFSEKVTQFFLNHN